VVLALPGQASAYASYQTTTLPELHPVNNPNYWGPIQNYLRYDTPTPPTVTNPVPATTGAQRALNTARGLLGVRPALSVLGTLTLGVGAADLGWKIGRTLDTKWLHISCYDDTTCGTSAMLSSASYQAFKKAWVWDASPPAWIQSSSGGVCTASGCWLLRVRYGTPTPTTEATSFGNTSSSNGAMPAIDQALTTGVSLGTYVNGALNCGNAYCAYRAASAAQMEATLQQDNWQTWTSALPADVATTGWAPGSAAAESATAKTVRDTIGADAALAAWFAEALEPGYASTPGADTETGTILLPQPELDETAAEYRARLRALGWLGTFVIVDAPLPLPTLTGGRAWKDGDPVRIKVGTNTGTGYRLTVPVYSPWPGDPNGDTPDEPAPEVGQRERVTWEKVPTGEGTRTGTAEGPPGVATPGAGSGACVCPDPDFSPLTSLQLGDKFPFGVVVFVDDYLEGTLLTAGQAPSFEFDFSSWSTPLGSFNLGYYNVDLAVMDDYVASVRTMLAFVVWIGGLWWFGTRWFGFKGGGDPGAAVDEAYD
jgi:hypothetical protein